MSFQHLATDCQTLQLCDKEKTFGSAIDDVSRVVGRFEKLVNAANILNPSVVESVRQRGGIVYENSKLSAQLAASIVETGEKAKTAVSFLAMQPKFNISQCSEVLERNWNEIHGEVSVAQSHLDATAQSRLDEAAQSRTPSTNQDQSQAPFPDQTPSVDPAESSKSTKRAPSSRSTDAWLRRRGKPFKQA